MPYSSNGYEKFSQIMSWMNLTIFENYSYGIFSLCNKKKYGWFFEEWFLSEQMGREKNIYSNYSISCIEKYNFFRIILELKLKIILELKLKSQITPD